MTGVQTCALPISAHLHIGNGLLGGLADFLCLPVLFLLHDDPLLFLSGKGIAVNDTVFDGHLRLCLCCAVAVSYTHLDVYKRQMES